LPTSIAKRLTLLVITAVVKRFSAVIASTR
jgi:hypothetical protein